MDAPARARKRGTRPTNQQLESAEGYKKKMAKAADAAKQQHEKLKEQMQDLQKDPEEGMDEPSTQSQATPCIWCLGGADGLKPSPSGSPHLP